MLRCLGISFAITWCRVSSYTWCCVCFVQCRYLYHLSYTIDKKIQVRAVSDWSFPHPCKTWPWERLSSLHFNARYALGLPCSQSKKLQKHSVVHMTSPKLINAWGLGSKSFSKRILNSGVLIKSNWTLTVRRWNDWYKDRERKYVVSTRLGVLFSQSQFIILIGYCVQSSFWIVSYCKQCYEYYQTMLP